VAKFFSASEKTLISPMFAKFNHIEASLKSHNSNLLMYWGLSNTFLYMAFKIQVSFKDDLGKIIEGNGTCFFAQNSKGQFFLVTNRHVLDKTYKDSTGKYKNFKPFKVVVEGKANDANSKPNLVQKMEVNGYLKYAEDQNNDVAVMHDFKVVGENAHLNYFVPYDLIASASDFASNLDTSDFLAFPGFPEWHDQKENRPIMRFGTIASDPRYNYSNNKNVKGDCLAYEAFSYGGSSGSPVFALQRGTSAGAITTSNARKLLFIGINAGHLKASSDGSHSGISYLYKSDVILRLIDKN
jgi:hypothetical protein